MKPDEMPLAVLELRRAGELVATPCRCGRRGCTLGEHVWRATKDMTAGGPRAANLDPSTRGARWETDDAGTVSPIPNDPTGEAAVHPAGAQAHAELNDALNTARAAARRVIELVGAHRPDRRPDDLEDPVDWCRHHLETLGVAEPRHRGDLCRRCYDFNAAHNQPPPRELLVMQREGRSWTAEAVKAALGRAREAARSPKGGKKRRRAPVT